MLYENCGGCCPLPEVWHVSVFHWLLHEVYQMYLRLWSVPNTTQYLHRESSEIDSLWHAEIFSRLNVSVHDILSCRRMQWDLFLFQCELCEEVMTDTGNFCTAIKKKITVSSSNMYSPVMTFLYLIHTWKINYDIMGGLDGWGVGVRVLIASRSALGSTQPPIQWVPGGLFPSGVRRQEREADHSPLTNAKVKKTWVCTSTPSYAFMAWSLIS
jgi:hypothetical protein